MRKIGTILLAGTMSAVPAPVSVDQLHPPHQETRQQSALAMQDILRELREQSGKSLTPINKVLREFPEAVPGSAAVEKIELPGASRLLIHIRQSHLVPGISPEHEVEVTEIQKDIEIILRYLVNKYCVTAVYKEGETVGGRHIDEVAVYAGDMNGARESLRSEGKVPEETTLERWRDRMRYELGGAGVVLFEDHVEARPAETERSVRRSMDKLLEITDPSCGPPDADKIPPEITDEREDVALQLIAERGDPINVLVYGGGHDFSDNVMQWNADHPNAMFSLIDITPASYAGYNSIRWWSRQNAEFTKKK